MFNDNDDDRDEPPKVKAGNKQDDDFFNKAKDMIYKLSDSIDKLDKKFGGENTNLKESPSEIEEKEKHILFDFIPEELCLDLLKYLEKHYQGSTLKELSEVFNLDHETLNDYVEILLNYGLIIERLLQKEKSYFIHDGSYYRFIQEIR